MKKIFFVWVSLLLFATAGSLCFGQQKTKTYKVGDVSFNMVFVEGGDTVIGRTSEQDQRASSCSTLAGGTLWNDPVYVTLDNYWIAETPVSQELWEAVMGSNPSKNKDDPKAPVTNVSWEDCYRFFYKINGLTGENFRFPTEAEWEYAARGGIKSQFYRFAGSNDMDEAMQKPNELGLMGMASDPKEWCKNGCDRYEVLRGGHNPQGCSSCPEKIIRGGKYRQLSERDAFAMGNRASFIGLRLARSVKQVVAEAE